jgi:uncharacterized protein (TIGR03083 family)
MDFDGRLSIIAAESDEFATAARGRLDRPVPTCPGWTLDDLVTHLATSYLDKVACTRLNARPDPSPVDPPAGDRVRWLLEVRDEMLDLFRERGPAAPSYTWEPSDQTVGFWARRMAVETSLHRVDAALAASRPYRLDPDLAADGIDETLTVILGGDWSHRPQPAPDCSVRLQTPARTWSVSLREKEVEVVADPAAGTADATVDGIAEDVLLWLWARPTRKSPRMSGDQAATARLLGQLNIIVG